METDPPVEGMEPPPATPPAGTVDDPLGDAPPATVPREAHIAERRKRQALEQELAGLRQAESDRQRKAAEKRGEWQKLHQQSEQQLQAVSSERDRFRRESIAARKLRSVPDDKLDGAIDYALYLYERTPDAGEFADFMGAELADGGRLHHFKQAAKPGGSPPPRSSNDEAPPIPAHVQAEADRVYNNGGRLYDGVDRDQHRRDYFQRRYGGKDPRAK